MGLATRIAPWFHRTKDGDSEGIMYRAWKRVWQQLPDFCEPTLFEQVERSNWDLLILLDAARYDTLRSVADAVVSKKISPASSTPEFLEAATETRLFSGAHYVSANPQVERRDTGAKRTEYLDDEWNDDLETIPPESVYRRAVELVQEGESVVAHTVQPHYPHIHRIDGDMEPVSGGLHPAETDIDLHDVVQGYLTNGNYDLEDALRSYEICTRFAWEEARRTAQRLRRKGFTIAITADHGEAFGEFGFVEHPVGVSIPQLRRVPWVEFTPNESSTDVDETVGNRLKSLGYR